MAVSALGDAALDALFLEYILPGLNIEVRENTILYDRFGTDSRSINALGKYAVFKCLSAAPMSARASSSTSFPTAQQGTYDDFTLYMKRGMYAQLQFDGLAIACGKGKGAVMELVKAESKGILITIANKLNRQHWQDGSGRLAQVESANVADTSLAFDNTLYGTDSNGYTDPHQLLDEGMYIDVYDTSGNIEVEEIKVSSITDDADGTGSLTMASNVTCSANSNIYDHDTYAASRAAGTGVPMGLLGIIDNSDPYCGHTQVYFQGQQRSANTWAQAQVVSMGSVAVTNQKMMETTHKVERYGRVNVIITNSIIWRAYYAILEADKTLPNEKAMWGGTTGLTFYGGRKGAIPVIRDDDCPDGRMFFIDENNISIYAPDKNGMQWLRGDNGRVLTRVQGKDEYTASLVWYYNMGSPKPIAEGVLESIKHASS